jgi:hypothetical protein
MKNEIGWMAASAVYPVPGYGRARQVQQFSPSQTPPFHQYISTLFSSIFILDQTAKEIDKIDTDMYKKSKKGMKPWIFLQVNSIY